MSEIEFYKQQKSEFDLEKKIARVEDQHHAFALSLYSPYQQNNYWQDICLAVILLIKIIFVHIRDSYYKYFCHFYGTLDLQKLNMKGNNNNIMVWCLFLSYPKELNILSIQIIILVLSVFRWAGVVPMSNKRMYTSQ